MSASWRGALERLVVSIGAGTVEIDCAGVRRTLGNDAVIVQAGGVLPTEVLRSIGIAIETKRGSA